jgi:hypothetical protein
VYCLHQKLYLQYILVTEVTTTHRKRSKTRSSHTHHLGPAKRSKDLLSDAYERLNAGKPFVAGHAGHEGPFESVREVEYKGHNITIRTQYEIRVDGKPLGGHIYVDNSGRVSSHAMPTYSFVSTVDLVKKLIDAFPANFAKVPRQISKQKKTGGRR